MDKPTSDQKPDATPRPGRARVDWDAVERDYRATQMTLRELAEKHGGTHSRIAQRAKQYGWTRDLRPAVKQATDAALIEAAVRQALTNESAQAVQDLTSTVLAVAEVNKQVILGHRTSLNRLTRINSKLLDQIEQAASLLPDLSEVVEMVRKPDENGLDRANDALRKSLSRSALVDDLKKLSDVAEKVRKGEREAFGLDDDPSEKEAGVTRSMTDAERAVRLANLLSRAGK